MVLLCMTLMASYGRQRFPWDQDAMPMESHSCSIFLTDMKRQDGSKEWCRFFKSEDLRPHPSCKLSAKDSIAHLVKPGAAVADYSTPNLTS